MGVGVIFRLRWTGLGLLSLVLLVATSVAAGAAAGAVGSDGDAAGGLAIVAVLLAGAVVNWGLGWQLNRRPTADGRVPVGLHTIMDTPMENASVVFVVFAAIFFASVVGRVTSPVLGWVVFVGVLLGVWIFVGGAPERRSRRKVADREEFAHQRRWRYAARDAGLFARWKDVMGWRATTQRAFGVVSGELDGIPFTVFDAMIGLDGRLVEWPRTTWAVHLPVAFPRLVVARRFTSGVGEVAHRLLSDMAGEPVADDPSFVRPEDVRAECEQPGFADALLTPEVRSATSAWGLAGWELAGRDLVFTSLENGETTPPAEIDAVLGRLVALARLFPPELAQRYGTPPSTEVPVIA